MTVQRTFPNIVALSVFANSRVRSRFFIHRHSVYCFLCRLLYIEHLGIVQFSVFILTPLLPQFFQTWKYLSALGVIHPSLCCRVFMWGYVLATVMPCIQANLITMAVKIWNCKRSLIADDISLVFKAYEVFAAFASAKVPEASISTLK